MGILDWLVIAAYGCMLVGVGAYYSRQNQTADDFLLGGRNMSPIAVGLSLFATLVSTLSYLGNPGEMIAHGPMMITQSAAHPLVFVIVGYGLIPLLMRQPVTSAYEILESRLGTSIRMAGAGVFLLLRFGWMATILFATSAIVLVPLFGIDPWRDASAGSDHDDRLRFVRRQEEMFLLRLHEDARGRRAAPALRQKCRGHAFSRAASD